MGLVSSPRGVWASRNWCIFLVCYTAVFGVVTQHSSRGTLRDDTKNGCVGDYYLSNFDEYKYNQIQVKQIILKDSGA